MHPDFASTTLDELVADLRGQGYIADRGLATSVLLALKLGKPLLLEGEVGVGKTELARTLAGGVRPHIMTLWHRFVIRKTGLSCSSTATDESIATYGSL